MVSFWKDRAIAIIQTIWKQDLSKSWHLSPGFKCFLKKWWAICPDSNDWASGFQIPFEIQTNWKPTSFLPFKIRMHPDFRSPLYKHVDRPDLAEFKIFTCKTNECIWLTKYWLSYWHNLDNKWYEWFYV